MYFSLCTSIGCGHVWCGGWVWGLTALLAAQRLLRLVVLCRVDGWLADGL
jgi:hypothetical protein